jgi:hypothetical protein
VKITLGNAAPVEVHYHNPDSAAHAQRLEVRGGNLLVQGEHVLHQIKLDPLVNNLTEVVVPDDRKALEIIQDVNHLWDFHSLLKPGWVLVDEVDHVKGDLVRRLLHDHFGLPIPAGPVALVTNAGFDYASKQLGGAASASAVAVNMALTANATAPAAGDTSLTGEITTAGGGLIRKACTYAHTTGASTYTLTVTFTANGSDTLPVTANKMGVFDATPSGGNMPIETLVSPAITWNSSGDAGTITETVTV